MSHYKAARRTNPDTNRPQWVVLHLETGVAYVPKTPGRDGALGLESRLNDTARIQEKAND
ncbi:hypothetical protein [Bradyrhizobium sp. 613_E4_N2_2]|uniref:hypothetical protein n=1 Tax=Bradyrhizobium sp. 613_E4_N2_2 TaxID=3240371 RepID=UPI003F8A3077